MGAIRPFAFRASSSCRERMQLSARKASDLLLNRHHPNLCWPFSQPTDARGGISANRRTSGRAREPVMMGFLLDTNVLSDLVRRPHGRIADRIAQVGEQDVGTSIIVAAEWRYGAARKAPPLRGAELEAV